MPDPLLLAHVLTVAAVLDAAVGVAFFIRWSANQGYGRGTPQYATARDSRRAAILAAVSALVILALAWLTPLGAVRLGGGA